VTDTDRLQLAIHDPFISLSLQQIQTLLFHETMTSQIQLG